MNHRMDRNSKEINLAKFNSIIIIRKHVSCKLYVIWKAIPHEHLMFLEKSTTKKYYSERDYLKHLD